MQIKNDLLLRVIKGEKVERTPVWLMRQAGRILPEYRAVRESVSGFIELAQTPELAAEVTIQPVDLLGVDAAIIFSDILVVPEAMGLPYEMIEKKGPWFPDTIGSAKDLKRLQIADPAESLNYVLEAIRLAKKGLNGRVPLIGFAGAPWTIFAYMVEGSGSKTFSKARAMLYQNPVLAHQLLEMITQTTIKYLKAQVQAGANVIQVFDSWAGVLPPYQYREFSMKYIRRICEAITEAPVTVFAKGAYFAMEDIKDLPCEVVGLDWNMDIATVSKQLNGEKVLQGNLDPAALYAADDVLVAQTKKMLDQFQGDRHIANLGHGVYPDISPDKVKLFIQTVKDYSRTKNKA
ncbi:uroporphyrinogen decarboxylase [Cyclobacterium qasimii]|uniref:Uroporphyrinogen decarboxylase n=2 Tax=Cyclobacterium qasimii TaxID=1350429 RepID=S7WLE1_9BACT|nr:uroporphyrinogen decarboxylase [Cyclobacterium qasimii]EPR67549.1 Uroporphyrinogen III decarboxylase [Cyclobacterium qasimii M12-11B]GEO21717.1 uroporphyrinogen decarboxylase [Cyclobacterium qasimii]